MSDPIMQALGRIEGKLDAEIKAAEEHREDDKRRFGDVFKRLDQHEADINQAKGAKGMLVWLVGGGAAAIAALVSMFVKAKGGG